MGPRFEGRVDRTIRPARECLHGFEWNPWGINLLRGFAHGRRHDE